MAFPYLDHQYQDKINPWVEVISSFDEQRFQPHRNQREELL